MQVFPSLVARSFFFRCFVSGELQKNVVECRLVQSEGLDSNAVLLDTFENTLDLAHTAVDSDSDRMIFFMAERFGPQCRHRFTQVGIGCEHKLEPVSEPRLEAMATRAEVEMYYI